MKEKLIIEKQKELIKIRKSIIYYLQGVGKRDTETTLQGYYKIEKKLESELSALEQSPDKVNIYDIDFGGHCMAGLSIKDNNITVIGAINGYGSNIPKYEIKITKRD